MRRHSEMREFEAGDSRTRFWPEALTKPILNFGAQSYDPIFTPHTSYDPAETSLVSLSKFPRFALTR